MATRHAMFDISVSIFPRRQSVSMTYHQRLLLFLITLLYRLKLAFPTNHASLYKPLVIREIDSAHLWWWNC